MKLIMIGASGALGIETVKQALSAGFEVTALVRAPEKFQAPAGVRVLKGDVLNPNSLETAMVGHDVVISALGSKFSRKPTTLLSVGTQNLVEAMKKGGVPRLICVTGIGAGESKGHGGFLYDRIIEPFFLHEIYQDKTRQEEVVRKSGLEWVIVRPAMLTNARSAKSFKAVTDFKGFSSSKISRALVARFLLEQVRSNEFLKKAPVITE